MNTKIVLICLFIALCAIPVQAETNDTEVFDLSRLYYWLPNDTTNDHNCTVQYHCMDFSIDLAHNLTAEGFDVRIVSIYPKVSNVYGHMIVAVYLPDNVTYYIDPMVNGDTIFNKDEYIDWKNEWDQYMIREISIQSAEMKRSTQYQWIGR